MSAPAGPGSDLASRVQQYLDERRRLGFKLYSPARALPNFERFVTNTGHTGPLTIDLMVQWARQVQARHMVDGLADSDTATQRHSGAPAGGAAAVHALATAIRAGHRSSG